MELKYFNLPEGSFLRELQNLINKHSIEGGSDTPDFILAEYLKQCLDAFDMCVRRREEWYGRVYEDLSVLVNEEKEYESNT